MIFNNCYQLQQLKHRDLLFLYFPSVSCHQLQLIMFQFVKCLWNLWHIYVKIPCMYNNVFNTSQSANKNKMGHKYRRLIKSILRSTISFVLPQLTYSCTFGKIHPPVHKISSRSQRNLLQNRFDNCTVGERYLQYFIDPVCLKKSRPLHCCYRKSSTFNYPQEPKCNDKKKPVEIKI